MSKKIATFKDLDTLASLDTGTSAGYISGAENEQCVTKGNFDTVSTKTIAAKGNGLMFVDGSESSKYESNRLILLDDVQYISEITAVLVSAPNIPAKGGSAYATWKLSQSYKVNGDASPSVIEWTVDGSTVSASSKGTTISAETNVANSTATVTKNGKSISLSQMIKQDLNKMVSLSGTTSTFSYGTKIVAGGGSVSPTLSGNGGTVTFSSTATLAASSCEGYKYTRSWSATNSGLWTLDASNGKLTATSKLTNIGNETTSMTVTGSCTCKVVNPSSVGGDTLSKNATATATAKQNGNYVIELTIGSHSLSYAAIGAGATSASPTHNAGTLTYKFSSGSTTTTKPADTYGTLSDTHTYTLAESKNGFTSVNSSNGTLTATSYGTTIGNARTSATVTCTRTCKWTPTSSYNAAGTITKTGAATATCTQNGNYVTKVEPKPSSGVAHVKYSNISAGGTTSSPQGTGAATYTFSSGSTTTDSSGSPSFGGSASYSRTYAEKANSDASDAFTVNTTNGTVTTSHRGTTPGDARSVTVTATLVVKYTHATGMSAPNASVSGTLVNDVVVTQNENKITSYGNWTTPTVTVNPDSFAAAGGTATITISGDSTRQNTWSSGSKSTDTAYKSNKSASFATISSDYKTLTVGVNTTGSNRTGHVYVDWSFESDNNVVKSVVSNGYSQVGQSDCTLTLTGSTKVYHETATIIGKASVAGTIYWGTSPTSMTQSTSVSKDVDTTITDRTSLGTTTIYAYFVPTDKNYKTLGSSSAYHTSASAKITQASDASITITTSNKTYNGSAQTVVTCDPTHGVSTWALGYATSSSATADSGVTWIADKTNLSLTNAGTYYIWRRWTADGNHSNSNSGAKIDATVTISKKAATVTAGSTSKTYDGSALTYKNATLSGQVSGHTLGSYTCTGSITNVGSANNVPSAAKILSGSTDVTANYNITYKNGTLTVSNASFTVSAPNQTYTYTGSAQGAAITVSGLKGSQTATIKYGTTSGTYDTTTAPKITNANEDKTIYWQVTAPNHATQTGSYTITMNKATPTMTLTGASKTYDGNTYYVSAKASVAGTVYYGTTSATSGMTSTKSVSANTSANLTGRKDAGTTTVYAYFVPTDGTNYNSLGSSSNDHTSASVVISKATGYLTATTTNRTYTGSAQTIGTISTNSGTYYFGLGSSTTSAPTSWGSANTALTATTAGTYYVWAKCDVSTNYNAVSAKYIGTVTIGKATPTMTLAGSNKTYNGSASYITATASVAGKVYYGTTSATSGMSTAVSVSANTATNLTSITNAGTLTVYAYFVPTDTANYNSLGSSSNDHASKSITISKATPTLTLTGASKTYDGNTYYVSAKASVAGTVYYGTTSATSDMTSTKAVSANTSANLTGRKDYGTTTVYAYFVPTDGTNYNSLGSSSNDHTSASVTISKATGYLTATVNTPLTYNGSAHTIATISTNSGSYYFGLGSSTTSAPTSWGAANKALTATTAGTYYVWAKCDGATNYNAVSQKYIGTVVINKATPTMTLAGSNKTYNGSASYITATASVAGKVYYGTTSATSGMSTAVSVSANTATNLTSITNAGTLTVYAYFVPTDTTNYNSLGSSSNDHASKSITISKATPTMTLTGASKTYDGNTYYVSAKASVAGTVYYGTTSATSGMTSTKAVSANTSANLTGRKDYGTTTVYAYFVPTDGTNYNSLGSSSNDHTSASVVISKATGYLTATVKTPLTYTGSAQTIATISTNSGSYYFGLGSSTTSAPTSWGSANTALTATTAGTYYVWAKCDVSTNYNAVSQKYIGTVVINKATPTLTLTGASKTYDGTAYAVTGKASVAGKIYYGTTSATSGMTSNKDATANTAVTLATRTNAGTTTVYAYFVPTDGTNYNSLGSSSNDHTSASVVISKATPTMTLTGASKTYDGNTYYVSAKASVAGTVYYGTTSSTSGMTSNKAVSANTATNLTGRKDYGTTTVYAYFVPTDGTNYNSLGSSSNDHTSASVTISKTTGYLTATTTNRTYTGSAQTIATISTNSGTYYFGLGSSTTSAPTSWGSANTALTATTAGTYYVWAKCDASTNYNAVSAKYIGTVTFGKATPTLTLTGASKTYDGTAYAVTGKASVAGKIYYGTTSATSGMTSTKDATANTAVTLATRTNAGTTTVYAYFVPTDGTNYNSLGSSSNDHTSASVVISKATPTMTLTGASKTYDGNTYYVSAKASVAGTVYYGTTSATSGMTSNKGVSANTSANLTGRKDYGTTTVYAYFVPTDGTNYNSLGSSSNDHASASVTISKATGYLTATTTNRTYTGSAQTIATISTNSGTYYFGLGSSTTSAPTSWGSANTALTATTAGTYYVWAKCDASTNYNAVSAKYIGTVTIGKATGSITVSRKTLTYNGSAQTIATATATGTYYLGLGSSSTSAPTSWGSANTALTATTAGTYYVWAKCDAGTNHNAVSAYYVGTAVINKKATTAPTLTAGSKTTYDGSAVYAKAASVSGNPAGKIYYGASSGATTYNISVTAGSTTASNLSSMGQTNVGTTTIYAFFRPTDTTNYADSSVVSTTAKVTNKATPTLTLSGSSVSYGSTATVTGKASVAGKIYYGTTSATSGMTSTQSASANTNYTLASRTAVGTTTVYAYFEPTDTTNYNSLGSSSNDHASASAVVGKATGYLTATVNTPLTYNGSAQTIATISTNSGSYYFGFGSSSTSAPSSWGSANKALTVTNAGTYYVWAKCDASTNYNAVSAKYIGTVVINKVTPTLTLSGTSVTYGSTATVTGKASVAGKIYYGTTSATSGMTSVQSASANTNYTLASRTAVGTTTVYAYFEPTDITNYNSLGSSSNDHTSASAVVGKASGSITFSPANKSVTCKNSSTQMTAADTVTITSATGATGTVTYTLNTGSTTLSNCSLSGTTLTVPKNTAVGTYTISITANSAATTNYNSASKTSTFTLSVIADTLKSGYSGTLSISPATILSAGADSRTITWGAIYQTWTNGGGKYYPSGTATLTQSCNNTTANTFVTINNTSYTNSSSTKESTLTKNSYGSYNHPVGATFTYTLKLGSTTIDTLTVYAEANTYTQTETGITAYGTPTISIGDGMTAAGGSATVTCTVKNTMGTKTVFTSGYSYTGTKEVDGTATWSISSQSCVGGGTRFVKSGNTLAHTTMGANEGVDSVSLLVVNAGDSTKTSGTGKGISNYKVHTLTGITLSYTSAAYSSGSTCTPTVQYSTSYKYESGASGSTTSGNTSSITNATFTKTFSVYQADSNASLNTSTGVVTWNSANMTTATRAHVVTCTGSLTSSGNTTSKTTSPASALQNFGGTSTTYNISVTFVNSRCAANCQYQITANGVSYTVNSSTAAGQLGSKTFSNVSQVTIVVRGVQNTSGSSKTLTMSFSGGGGTTSPSNSVSATIPSPTTNGTITKSITLIRNSGVNMGGSIVVTMA